VQACSRDRDRLRGKNNNAVSVLAPRGWVLGAAIVAVSMMPAASPALAAKTASMVIDANSGKVLHAKHANAARYPASLTKMMTLYMVFEALKAGRLSLGDKIRVSRYAASKPPSKLHLKPGESISVGNAIRALVTKSANDVAAAVAEHLGGTEAKFGRMMTRKAREIGMKSTRFRNASGLPDRRQRTTARDMITLGLRLQDNFPSYYKVFRTRRFTYRGKTYRNHNRLLGRFHGTDGIKTGYIRASGFNLVSSVRRGRKHVVAAVFGSPSGRARNAKMRILLARALKRASTQKTRDVRPKLVARPKTVGRGPIRSASRRLPPAPPRLKVRPPQPSPAQPPRQLARKSIQIARVRPQKFAANGRLTDARRPVGRSDRPTTAPRPILAPPLSITDLLAKSAPSRRASSPAAARSTQRTANGARRPSTLQAQAAALSGAQTRSGAKTTVERAGASGVQIQVGAYYSQDQAQSRLSAVKRTVGDLLSRGRPMTMAVRKGNRRIYRARFAGFDATSASRTCSSLRARGVDCHVSR